MQTLEIINVGQAPNDGKGEDFRSAFQKVNANFAKTAEGIGEVGAAAQAASELAAAAIPASARNTAGGVAGLGDDARIAEANSRFPVVQNVTAAANLDTFLTSDDFYVNVAMTNQPAGVAGAYLLRVRARTGAVMQEITQRQATARRWWRMLYLSDGSWSAWREAADVAGTVPVSALGQANGVATLGENGKVRPEQLPNAVDAIPLSQKGVADGVASLDSSVRLVQQHAFCESIPVGTNANDMVLPGFYVIQSDANATAALNWPILLAGTLLVEATVLGNLQVTQTFTTRNAPSGGAVRSFKRVRFGGSNAWGTWQEVAGIADLASLSALLAQAFGVNQSWQNVAAGRAADINYTNATGRPLIMTATALLSGPNGRIIFYVDNRVAQDAFNPSAGATLGGMVVIPAGSVGKIVPVAASINSWWEYR